MSTRTTLSVIDGGLNRGDPVRCPRVFTRLRPLEWLASASQAQILLLQAPAGYGKTGVLEQWCEQSRSAGRNTASLSCNSALESHSAFCATLLKTLGEGLRNAVLDIAETTKDQSAAVQSLCQGLSTPLDLFIDEEAFQLSAGSLNLLWSLVSISPHLRIFVATRRKLTNGLARVLAQGRVALIGAEQLALNRAETRAFLDSQGVAVSPTSLESVMACTRGWLLALRLLATLRPTIADVTAAAMNLSDRPELREFFSEEVIQRLDKRQREFLESVGILDRMCASLCDAITLRSDSEQQLNALSAKGAFLAPDPEQNGWFRLHPLFASYLRSEVSDGKRQDERRRHRRAQEWFDEAGMFIDAFEHAIDAGEIEQAANVLNSHCDDLYLEGKERSILPTASRLPADIQNRFPRLMLAISWRMMAEWRFDQADMLLVGAESKLAEMRLKNDASKGELSELEFEIKHRRMVQSLFREDFPRVEQEADNILKDVEHLTNPYIVMTVYSAMMYAQREQYKLGQLARLESTAREYLERISSRDVHVFLEAIVAPGRLLQGETTAAMLGLQKSLDLAVDISGPGSALGATVALTLAEALYVTNQTDSARTLLDAYLPVATALGFVDQLISGYVTQARLEMRDGRLPAALATLHEADTLAAERGFHRLGSFAFSERVSLLCRAGEEAEAIRIAEWHGLKLTVPPAAPRKGSTREDNAMAMTWVRLAHAQGHLHEASSVAKAWRNHTSAAKALTAVLEWDILRARLLVASNELTAAQRVILQALALAAPARQIRPFVDEALRLSSVFDQLSPSSAQGAATEAFVNEVLAVIEVERGVRHSGKAREHEPDQVYLTADLTARELSILKLVAAGHLNAEVGRRLGLTAGTIKWYLHRIYGKLGCRRRVQVLEQARRLGLIS